MDVADAQREIRNRFLRGFYGHMVSGVPWLASAALATWRTASEAILFVQGDRCLNAAEASFS